MARLNKSLVVSGIFGLIALLSLLNVGLFGCAQKSVKTKPARQGGTKILDPSRVDLSKYISSEEKVLKKRFVDVNKDGKKEIIFLTAKSWDPERPDPWLIRIRILTWDGSKYTSSWEMKLIGERSVKLKAEDINKDSIVEILSYQTIGNASMLYVMAWDGSSYRTLKPFGGTSEDYFGVKGAKVKDDDKDGVKEIYAYYGPAGSKADIYKWDGRDYKFFKTVSFPTDNFPLH